MKKIAYFIIGLAMFPALAQAESGFRFNPSSVTLIGLMEGDGSALTGVTAQSVPPSGVDLSTVTLALADKVAKAGDTMTGSLVIKANTAKVTLQKDGNTNTQGVLGYNASAGGYLSLRNPADSEPQVSFALLEQYDFINTGWPLGIGTITPTEKLDVAGNVKGTDFKSTAYPSGLSPEITSLHSATSTLTGRADAIAVSTGLISADLTTEISNRENADIAIGLTTGSLRTDLTQETSDRQSADSAIGLTTGTLRADLTSLENSASAQFAQVAIDTTSIYNLASGKVSKAGDTMTGDLIIDGATDTPLTLYGADGGASKVELYSFGAGGGPFYQTYRSLGTQASPTAITANTAIGSFGGKGYDGTAYSSSLTGSMSVYASENWSNPNNHGTYLAFRTTADGSASGAERVRISSAGYMGVGTTTPAEKLDVNGKVKASSFVIGYERIATACATSLTCQATCTGAKKVMGGGCSASPMTAPLQGYPSTETAWTCDSNSSANLTSYALCGLVE